MAITPETGIFDHATDSFIKLFVGYQNQFVTWGKEIFLSLLIINIVLISIKYAFQKHSIQESLPDFIRQFFIAAFFFTLLINIPWLYGLIETSQNMGETFTHSLLTPSSVIHNGLAIGAKVLIAAEKASLLTMTFGVFVAFLVYLLMLFVFFSVALELAVTLIMAWWLAVISAIFFAFAAIGITQKIANQSFEVLLGQCIKLLGLYLVIGIGQTVMQELYTQIPTHWISFDPYGWLLATALLFWLLAKNFPQQLSLIVSHSVNKTTGTDAGALALTAQRIARSPIGQLGMAATAGVAQGIGSTLHHAKSAFDQARSNGMGLGASMGSSLGSTTHHALNAAYGSISDRFKHMMNKLSGGQGLAESSGHIPGFAQRMYGDSHPVQKSSTNHKNESTNSTKPSNRKKR